MHLSSNMTQSLGTVYAESFTTAVSQHTQHLRVLLSIFLKNQLSLLVLGLILSSLAILSSLSLVLRHVCRLPTRLTREMKSF
ncbi:hypothetical protein Mapa_001746 [Marchantia paleacea]|nr:hypothetical protein Mapa_001746 [Marchantia paleacea]